MYSKAFAIFLLHLCLFQILNAVHAKQNQEKDFVEKSSFNGYCDQLIRCDSKAALKCDDNKCKCVRPEAMIFDNYVKKCLVMSGERCSYTAVEVAGTNTNEVKKWIEQVDCVENAECSRDGYCTCISNFMEARNGTCVPKRLFGEPCQGNLQCRGDKHLTCIDERCTCNQTTLAYSERQEKCVTLAGKRLSENDRSCVENAYHDSDYNNHYCTCHSGFSKSQDGLCLVPLGGTCGATTQSQCERSLICKNEKCVCRYSKQKISLVGEAFQCISLVNQPCKVIIPETHLLEEKGKLRNVSYGCTANSECIEDESIFECRCKNGFVEANGECQLDYDESCTSATEKCDEIRGLQCIESKCQCPIDDLHYFHEETKTCKGLVGAECNITVAKTTDCEAVSTQFCTIGAICKPGRNTTSGCGWCRCADGFKTTADRLCVEVIRMELETASLATTGECDGKSHLISGRGAWN